MPSGSSLTVKKIKEILATLKKPTLASRSVPAMTDKLWVKKRLCKCLKGTKKKKKKGMPHLE